LTRSLSPNFMNQDTNTNKSPKNIKTSSMKLSFIVFLVFITVVNHACGQYKIEREFRIKKNQFPPTAIGVLEKYVTNAKRLKFYKETDSIKKSYEVKFKKDKLWYSVEFDTVGTLEDVEIIVQPTDIPQETFTKVKTYFKQRFEKYRIKKIQQQYPAKASESVETTLRNAFQNLLLPTLFYEIEVAGKIDKNYVEYEVLFDAQGNFKTSRERLPPNYDHVLY